MFRLVFFRIFLIVFSFMFGSVELSAQDKWYAQLSVSSGPTFMVFALKENPFLYGRTTVSVNNSWGHHQRIAAHLGKSSSKALFLLGLQHNVNKVKINYIKFNNPLIKEGSASQVFDLRYFSVPMGIGRRMRTSDKSELSMSFFSELLATYRLRCVDSSINVRFTDNTNDNLAAVNSIYEYYGTVFLGNIGAAVNYNVLLKNRIHFNVSAGTVWQPKTTSWIYMGAEMHAGGQQEYVRVSSAVVKYTLSLGLTLAI